MLYTTSIPIRAKKQLEVLKNQILGQPSVTGENAFYVFSIEAGLGKTETLIEAMAEQYKRDPLVKSLVVTKLNVEGKQLADRINNVLNDNVALFYNEEKQNNWLITVARKYTILIITHSKYKALNLNSIQKKAERTIIFQPGRKNLIIDEELNYIDIGVFDRQLILSTLNILDGLPKTNFKDMYFKLTTKWDSLLKANIKNNQATIVYFENNIIEDDIIELAEAIFKHDFPKDHFADNFFIRSKMDLIKNIELIASLYNRNIILMGDKIYIDNTVSGLFRLKNNIILDATASCNARYDIDPGYRVITAERITDHSKWTLHWYKDNSSRSAKRGNVLYFEKMRDFIRHNLHITDKALVITNKSEAIIFKDEFSKRKNIEFINFGEMRGKNNWRDYNKCFIIHTPALPHIYYPITYMSITGDVLTNKEMHFLRSGNTMKFVNHGQSQKLLDDDIACSIYQALKRINRSNVLDAQVFVFSNRQDIMRKVIAQLKNINVIEHEPILKKRRYKSLFRKSRYEKDFISIMKVGLKKANARSQDVEYRKKDICGKINCNPHNFSKLVLKRITVIDFMNRNNIESKGQKIIVRHQTPQ